MKRRIVKVVRRLGSHMTAVEYWLECGHIVLYSGYWRNHNRYALCTKCPA